MWSLFLRVSLAGAALLAVVACTRTYDGTVVPKYRVKMVRTSALPRIAIAPTPVEPANAQPIYRFPEPPPPPPPPALGPPPRTIARAPAVTEREGALACRPAGRRGGRVHVVCQ